VGIFAKNPARDLVGNGLADHRGAGCHQHAHHPGGVRCGFMGGFPVRVTAASDIADDVEDILCGKGQVRERTTGHYFQISVSVFAKGVQTVINRQLRSHHMHRSMLASRSVLVL
jgi:hypothetical protein